MIRNVTILVYNPVNTVIVKKPNGLNYRYFELPIDVLRGTRTAKDVVIQFPKNFILIIVPDGDARQATETTVEAYCLP